MIRQLRSAPNILTLLRLIFVPFIIIALQQHRYAIALGIFVLAGVTDGLDGLVARLMKQKTTLGQYLDPIADKLLLSTMFLVLSLMHRIPWVVTVLVFSRDIMILIVCTLLYATSVMKTFRPSWFGKANTVSQIATVPVVLLHEIFPSLHWIALLRQFGFNATMFLTIVSGVHYVIRLALNLRQPGSKAEEAGR
jgi:cardiolipin synthase